MGKTSRSLLVAAGTLSLGLGIIGVFVPILPTTPFLLLAAFCYMRSSERLYRWMLNNKLFGTFVRDYLQGRGMAFRAKLLIIVLLWTTIGTTIAFGVQNTAIRVVLVCIAIGVTIHISLIRTKKVRNGIGN